MKAFVIVALLLSSIVTALHADDRFIKMTAIVTIAGEPHNTASVTTKSGREARVTHPFTDELTGDKAKMVITTKSSFVDDTLNYDISVSIPTAGTVNLISAKGTSENGKPITYSFQKNGKLYGFNIVLASATADGTLK